MPSTQKMVYLIPEVVVVLGSVQAQNCELTRILRSRGINFGYPHSIESVEGTLIFKHAKKIMRWATDPVLPLVGYYGDTDKDIFKMAFLSNPSSEEIAQLQASLSRARVS